MNRRPPRPSRPLKSTNVRIVALCLSVLWVGSAAQAGPAPEIAPELRELAVAAAGDPGSDAARMRRLHEALRAHPAAPEGGPELAFQLAGLAREAGILCFLVTPNATADTPLQAQTLAAGIFRARRIVVFDSREVRSVPRHRVRPVGDREARAAILARDGRALLAAGDPEAAVRELEAAVALDPARGDAWRDLGEALRRQGERERALDAYETSLALLPRP